MDVHSMMLLWLCMMFAPSVMGINIPLADVSNSTVSGDLEAKLQDLMERFSALEQQFGIRSKREDSLALRQHVESASNGTDGFIGGPDNPAPASEQCLCPPGTPGAMGIPGRDGRDGRDFYGCEADHDHDNEDEDTNSVNATFGISFVRWGKSECSSSSELIYHGTMAGSYYTHAGGGSNYLCMPDNPIFDGPQVGTSSQSRSYIYGAEYEMNNFANWNHLHENNAPCAVCWAPSRSSVLMVPARNVCPGSEWTKEFSGYIVSSYYGHTRSEFVCMDRHPDVIPRSSHNANGALLYVAEARCGSGGSGLPCGPYVDGYEVTCAVCTR